LLPATINRTVLMSGAEYMSNASPINAWMNAHEPFNVERAVSQHQAIKAALEASGVKVISCPAPADCQDGVFTANWGLGRDNKILLSSLPTVRRPEQAVARQILEALGKDVYSLPEGIKFSGQGDALPCGKYVFMGTGYRTDLEAHTAVAETLGYEVIGVQTIPVLDSQHEPVINKETGWPDSRFYDLDLAIAILRFPDGEQKGLIAWCPEAFVPDSQAIMRSIDFVEKIEVPYSEAVQASACNLVSTGSHVVMNAAAPVLQTAIEAHGLSVTALVNDELAKNGGSVRCTTLTLDNGS
jgi:N-dimethylarginine dimethylaminohydrolase